MVHAIRANAKLRMMGAVIDTSDRRLLGFEAIAHPSRQGQVRVLVEKPAPDAGLIGDDDDRPAQLIDREARQIENSWNEFELVRAMDIAAVNVDDAVAVEKEGAPAHGGRH